MRAQDIIRALLNVLDEINTEKKYANQPDEQYFSSTDAAYPDGDDLHKSKKSYPHAAGGDNPMALDKD